MSEADETPPEVISLDYPPNNANLSTVSVDFNFTAQDDHNVSNCTLWGNFSGDWASNETVYNVANNTETNITISPGDGYYIWNVQCWDNATTPQSDWYGSNYTVTIDTTQPNITIVSPLNDTYTTSTVYFNISLQSGEHGDWCGYSLGGAANLTMTKINNTYFWAVNTTMTEDSHNVVFYCNDTSGNMNKSLTRYFTVEMCSIAIGLSNPLDSGINWTVTGLPVFNLPANGNNDAGATSYNVSISITGSCTTDIYIRADGDLQGEGGVIELGNETYCYNTTDSTVPGTACTVLDTDYAGNQIGSDLGDGEKVYLKFYMTVPGGQPTGDYNNTESIKGVKSGEQP